MVDRKSETDDTLPANMRGRLRTTERGGTNAPAVEAVDVNARQSFRDLQDIVLRHVVTVGAALSDGAARMKQHDDNLSTQSGKIDAVAASVKKLDIKFSTKFTELETLVEKGTDRVHLLTMVAAWGTFAVLLTFLVIRLYTPLENWIKDNAAAATAQQTMHD